MLMEQGNKPFCDSAKSEIDLMMAVRNRPFTAPDVAEMIGRSASWTKSRMYMLAEAGVVRKLSGTGKPGRPALWILSSILFLSGCACGPQQQQEAAASMALSTGFAALRGFDELALADMAITGIYEAHKCGGRP
jgi:hypothetical protein